jgi:hypothetical protein
MIDNSLIDVGCWFLIASLIVIISAISVFPAPLGATITRFSLLNKCGKAFFWMSVNSRMFFFFRISVIISLDHSSC